METNPNKATPRVYHTLRQIVQRIPRWLIEKTANAHGVDARKFSATSHFVMLILGHLSRASCLTEICDDADLNRRKLSLVRIEAGKPHDSTVADELTKDMKGGDILLADRAYVDFAFLHNLTAREVFWVLRQKVNMLYDVVESREVSGNVRSDEIVNLTAANTSAKYPETFRRVRAIVEINGEKREMVFLTNNAQWAASTICELYKARWEIEVFFKELKQTLQLTDFIGTNENAVKWQIWTGRSRASSESCALRYGWTSTSWRPFASMG